MRIILNIMLILFLFSNKLFAEIQETKIKLDGTASFIIAETVAKKIGIYGISTGNSTSRVGFELVGPKGIRFTAKSGFIKKYNPKKINLKNQTWEALNLESREELSKNHSSCLEIAPAEFEEQVADAINISNFPPRNHPICDNFGQKELTLLAEQLSLTYGGNWQTGNVCAYLVYLYQLAGGANYEVPDPSSIPPFVNFIRANETKTYESFTLLRKNACSKANNQAYIIYFTINLSRIKASKYPDGIPIMIRVNEYIHQGSKASSIKPVSEGRHAPKPLVMMNWLGSNCGTKMQLTTWRNNKPLASKSLNSYAYLPYKDLVLGLAPVDKFLTGGRGTFEIFSERDAYGVCFELVRKRQRVEGYPR